MQHDLHFQCPLRLRGRGRREFFMSLILWLTRTANATQGTATGQKRRGEALPVGSSTGGHLGMLYSWVLQTHCHGFIRQQPRRNCPTFHENQPRTQNDFTYFRLSARWNLVWIILDIIFFKLNFKTLNLQGKVTKTAFLMNSRSHSSW